MQSKDLGSVKSDITQSIQVSLIPSDYGDGTSASIFLDRAAPRRGFVREKEEVKP